MLEVRYNTITKELTGWCGDPMQFGNLKDRGNEAIVVLDIAVPDKPLDAWLCDGKSILPNPGYIEPIPPRNLAAEIDKLKARVDKLEKK